MFKFFLIPVVVFILFLNTFAMAGKSDFDKLTSLDRLVSGISDGAISPEEIYEARFDLPVAHEDIHACVDSSTPLDCLSQSMRPYFRAFGSPTASVLSTLVATTALYPLNLMKMREQTKTAISGGPFRGFLPYSAALLVSRLDFVMYDALKAKGWTTAEAGAFSGALISFPASPFWMYHTKKTLKQKDIPEATVLEKAASLGRPHRADSYNLKCYIRDLRADPKMAFRGQAIGVACSLPLSLQFYLMDYFESQLKSSSDLVPAEDAPRSIFTSNTRAFSAAGSRLLVMSIFYPLDTIRLNRQQTGMSYNEILKNLFAEEGVIRFYRGSLIALSKQTVWTFAYFGLYEWLKQQFATLSAIQDEKK